MKYYIVLIVIMILIFAGCEKDQKDYIQKNKNQILYVYASTVNVEADGKSTIKLVASISPDADLKTIGFHTSNGAFQDNAKDSLVLTAEINNDSLQAITYLIATTTVTSNVIMRVSVPGVDTLLLVNFVNAYPDSIHVESVLGAVKSDFNSETNIQAQLIRQNGVPSLHQRIYFKAITDKNDSIGDFRNISVLGSDSNGLVTAVFQLKDTAYKGAIRIYGRCMGKVNPLTDTVKIYVTK